MMNSGLPLVSCVMPTCNRRSYVPLAIAYFLRQEYPAKELVIIDDGSDDVGDLGPRHSQIRYLRQKKFLTLGDKRNACVEEAKAELILPWDDDDWMSSSRIAYQVSKLVAANAEVCGLSRMLFYNEASKTTWLYAWPKSMRSWLAGGSLLYTRDFWRRAPFPSVQVASDTMFVFSQPLDH